MNRAGILVTATAAAFLATAGWWCATALSDARVATAEATADTDQCQRLADQIRAARTSPTTAPSDVDLGPQLERALTAADVDPDALARVAPQPVHRTNGVARRTTAIGLRSVTLKQAVAFVAALAGDGRSVRLDAFHLTVPTTDGADDDGWDADLTVSQAAASAGGGT